MSVSSLPARFVAKAFYASLSSDHLIDVRVLFPYPAPDQLCICKYITVANRGIERSHRLLHQGRAIRLFVVREFSALVAMSPIGLWSLPRPIHLPAVSWRPLDRPNLPNLCWSLLLGLTPSRGGSWGTTLPSPLVKSKN